MVGGEGAAKEEGRGEKGGDGSAVKKPSFRFLNKSMSAKKSSAGG